MLPLWIAGSALALLMATVAGGRAQNAPGNSPISSTNTIGSLAPESTTRESTQAPPQIVSPKGSRLPPKTQFSPWAAEIVKLARAGVEENSILAFIDNTAGTFNLSADQIIYLNDLGVSSQVVTAMLEHDSELALGLRPLVATTVPTSRPAVQITFVSKNESAGKASKPSSTPQPVLVSTGNATIDNPAREPWPGPDESILTPESSQSEDDFMDQLDTGDSLAPLQPQSVSGNESYPVRKPYPVELTGPIVVIHAWSKTPNTLLIEFAP
jgi:hypothetical protein